MVSHVCSVGPQDAAAVGSIGLLARLGVGGLGLMLGEGGALLVWECGALRSGRPLACGLVESVGLGGPGWLGGGWRRGITESGGSGLSALVMKTPGDLV